MGLSYSLKLIPSLFPQDMHIIKNDIMNSMIENKQIVCTIY